MNPENPFKLIYDQLSALNDKVDNLIHNPENEPVELPINAIEASKLLGIAKGTLHNNISKYPHHKKRGKLYFFKSELIEYIRTGQIKTKKQIIQEVNERLADLKKGANPGRNQRHTPNKEELKNTDYSLSDKIKVTLVSATEQNENHQEATEETANFHYLQNESEIKEESEE